MKTKSLLIFLVFLILIAATLLSCSSNDDDDNNQDPTVTDDDTIDDDVADDDSDDDADDDAAHEGLSWLVATTGSDPAILDEDGRQILLRGVNFNHLGDYFVTDESLPTVAELGADDWDDAAALGMNVIRLVTSWSAWEPERGRIDQDYVAQVRAAVTEANAHGLYVVIDMHQDAWSKYVFTPVNEICPEGTYHQKGWDGAPEWATFTDGAETCTPGRREDSPAVIQAWENFYNNRDGIRDELVSLWTWIATEFAHDSGVAGFDLLNEPGSGLNILTTMTGLTEFYRLTIDAVRTAEDMEKSPGHIIFFEPNVNGIPPLFNLHEPNTVFAPHNYFGSIVQGPDWLLDFSFWLYDLLGTLYQTVLWIGEYNSFSDPATNELWTARFAALDDRYLQAGGTWWQWEQECGDPHNTMYPPTPEWIEQQQQTCGNARFPLTTCLSRGYPMAVPGRLRSIEANPCGETLVVTGATDIAGMADLWLPSVSDTEPAVSGTGIEQYLATRVDGGWRITAWVSGEYSITATPAGRRF